MKMYLSKKLKTHLAITILIVLPSLSLIGQQVWTQKKKEGILFISGSHFSYNKVHRNFNSNRQIPRSVRERIVKLYGEYGITNNWTFMLNLPFHLVSNGSINKDWIGISPEKGKLNAFGNISIASWYKLLQKNNFVFSSKLQYNLKTSVYENITGLRTGYNASTFSPRVLCGWSDSKIFTSIELGYSFIGNNYANRLEINYQLGKTLGKKENILIVLSLSSSNILEKIQPQISMNIDGYSIYTSLYMNEQEFFATTLKMGYVITKNWSSWISFAGGMANNIGQGIIYSIQFGYKFLKN